MGNVKELTRPIITIFLIVSWVVFLFCTYAGGGDFSDVPPFFTGLVATAFGWWFSSREKEKQNAGKAV